MSKYIKLEDVIRKRAEDLADNSYWEYGNPKNVDDWIEVAEMEFKDIPTIEVSEDCISRAWVQNKLTEYVKDYELNELDSWQNTIVEWIATDIEDAPSVIPKAKEGEWILECDAEGG